MIGRPRDFLKVVMRSLLTVDGICATVGVLALLLGLFIHSVTGWIVCGGAVVLAVAFLLLRGGSAKRKPDHLPGRSQGSDEPMKKLLFDDFQPSATTYVVKEVEDEQRVVLSTRTVRPVDTALPDEMQRELDLLDFFDLDADQPLADVEPKSEFHALLDRVLLVLKDVLFAHTAAFFWVNRDRQTLVIESRATDSTGFMTGRKLPLDTDVVSSVATTGKPVVSGNISAAARAEMLRYYSLPDAIRSVVAVPVYFRNSGADIQPVGVIVADSTAEDAFGPETLVLLGRFTKLVSALVKNSTDKFDLLLESELLTSIRRLQDRAKSEPTEQAVLASLGEEINRLVNWDCMTVTMYSEESHGWVVQKVVKKADRASVSSGQPVDTASSLVGEVIRSNRLEIVQDISAATLPRFAPGEPPSSGGTFLCVPISSLNRCYGALTLESATKGNFSGSEVEVIYRLVENAASLLEVVYMNTLITQFVVVDQNTGLMNPKYFLQKLDEEVVRATDLGQDLAFVSIAVDGLSDLALRYGKESPDAVLASLAGVVRTYLRPYDVIGRLEPSRVGILLVNTTASDGYLWAERMRKVIGSHVIRIGARTLSVTVSAGVCGLLDGMSTEDLRRGTTEVLGKALEGGGNLVRVF